MSALSHLSLQNVTGYRQPTVQTNEQRLKEYRPHLPAQFANVTFNDMFARLYAQAEMMDGRHSTTDTHGE